MFAIGGNVERMTMGDLDIALYDSGFYNIGVTPTRDLGIGAQDPFGNPLSFVGEAKNVLEASGQYLNCSYLCNQFVVAPDPFIVTCSSFVEPGWIWSTFRDAADGAFKVPTLRNIELTGPYFHNGSRATLEQVVEFYNRGGDRQGPSRRHQRVRGQPDERRPRHRPPRPDAADQAALVAFLKTLTDPRVANESAPFDHPSLRVTNGHVGDNTRGGPRRRQGAGPVPDAARGRRARPLGQGAGAGQGVPAIRESEDGFVSRRTMLSGGGEGHSERRGLSVGVTKVSVGGTRAVSRRDEGCQSERRGLLVGLKRDSD